MRIVIKYTKDDRVKYISHLDFVRLVQRALRRAHIPVAYSRGFNPHPRISFASALAVGITSEGEYMDIFLDSYMDPELLCTRINEKLPQGIRFIESIEIDETIPSLMSLIERAKYRISGPNNVFKGHDTEKLLKRFLSQTEIQVTITNRKGSRQVDIRQMIHSMNIVPKEDKTIIDATLSTGSKANLRPELLIETFLDYMGISTDAGLQFKIHRLNLYLYKNNIWLTPIEMG